MLGRHERCGSFRTVPEDDMSATERPAAKVVAAALAVVTVSAVVLVRSDVRFDLAPSPFQELR